MAKDFNNKSFFKNGLQKPTNISKTFSKGGYSTKDIINAILYADNLNQKYTADFAQKLKGTTIRDTCNNIWNFIKDNVEYREDKSGVQEVLSPGKLIDRGYGDCKSYSNFISSCLKNLGIPHLYRFISEDRDTDIHHVYIVALDENGKEIAIDCVIDSFDTEVPYEKKKDFKKSASGIGYTTAVSVKPSGKLVATIIFLGLGLLILND